MRWQSCDILCSDADPCSCGPRRAVRSASAGHRVLTEQRRSTLESWGASGAAAGSGRSWCSCTSCPAPPSWTTQRSGSSPCVSERWCPWECLGLANPQSRSSALPHSGQRDKRIDTRIRVNLKKNWLKKKYITRKKGYNYLLHNKSEVHFITLSFFEHIL